MLYLKIMSNSLLPDDHADKSFRLVPVANDEELSFTEPCPPCAEDLREADYVPRGLVIYAEIRRPDGSTREYALTGNAYVMNEHGKTIASRSPH